jgi:hypothetical protein
MVCRILFVETTSLYIEPERDLFIDAWVQVDWKMRMAIDEWSGDIETAPPSYKVRPHHSHSSEFDEYGVLSDPVEVA